MPAEAPSSPVSSASGSSNSRSVSPISDDDNKGHFTCPYCRSKIPASASTAHTASCKLRATNLGAAIHPLKRRLSDNSTDSKDAASSKKAKLSNDGDGKAKEKKKVVYPKKMGKHKAGPVDLNVQCGVQTEGGGQCARSLTCKTHAMAAKRAVVGRTAAYDVLLEEWQRRNNPNYVNRKNKSQGNASVPVNSSTPANAATPMSTGNVSAQGSAGPPPTSQTVNAAEPAAAATEKVNGSPATPQTNINQSPTRKSRKNKDIANAAGLSRRTGAAGLSGVAAMTFGEVSDTEAGSDEAADVDADDFDSEDEMEQVLAGLKSAADRAKPFPGLVTPFTTAFVVRDTKLGRWREKLAGAITRT